MRKQLSDDDLGKAGATPRRRGPGELEAEVLATLWTARQALTAGEVQPKLASELSYSTVVTILSRLHTKGVLSREQRGRAYAYRPVSDEPGLAARRMRQVLENEANRQQVLTRFVSGLSDEDERLLRTLIHERTAQPTDTGQEPRGQEPRP
ncbi:MAG TPA: BlaI/MecI/CopY family transcriptional regulator [Pseudonocardiaceae bacterium]|nr:BlaI/MecI/CopY family transcriptional regulator [Pseudonocardiaceae bacterium]